MTSEPPRTLGFAVWSDNADLVRALLDEGVPVDEYGPGDDGDFTPLMESVNEVPDFYDSDRAGVTGLLLAFGADVRRRDAVGRTALHYAAGTSASAVELLLAHGADESARDIDGRTPLHAAINRGNAASALRLSAAGADPSIRDVHGVSPHDLFAASEGEFTQHEVQMLRAAFRSR